LLCLAPQLVIRVINFEPVQPICPRYASTLRTDGQTDRQTDGRLTIAITRFVHYVHRAVKSEGVTDGEIGEDETGELTERFVATDNARLDNAAPEYKGR